VPGERCSPKKVSSHCAVETKVEVESSTPTFYF
jgi:hypothetical protein